MMKVTDVTTNVISALDATDFHENHSQDHVFNSQAHQNTHSNSLECQLSMPIGTVVLSKTSRLALLPKRTQLSTNKPTSLLLKPKPLNTSPNLLLKLKNGKLKSLNGNLLLKAN